MKLVHMMIPTKPEFDNTINKILQAPDYKNLKNSITDYIEKIKENLRDWFLKLLKNTFSDIKNSYHISDNLSTIFMLLGLLVIFALITVVIIKVSKTLSRNTKLKEILGEKIEEGTTPTSLRAKAVQHEGIGDFRQAVRYDFIAILLLMHNQRLIYLDETKTNAEIYNYLSKNCFGRLVEFRYLESKFNSIWYGYKQCHKNEYEAWSNNITLLWNEVTKQ